MRSGAVSGHWRAAVVGVLATGGVAGAQVDAARRDTSAPRDARQSNCDSLLRAARVDSVETTVRAYLLRTDNNALPEPTRSFMMRLVLSHFVAPKPLSLPVFASGPVRLRMLRPERMEGDGPSVREPVLYGVYTFRLLRAPNGQGRVDSVHVEVPTLALGFDSSIVRAITDAATDSSMRSVLRQLRKDRMPFQLRISSGAIDGRVRVAPLTVFTAPFPRIRMIDAHPDVANLPAEYPMLERVDGGDGEVLLRAVIDLDGKPLIATAEVLHATSPLFASSALRALARYRFTPARVGECGVPQVHEIPFWFSLRP